MGGRLSTAWVVAPAPTRGIAPRLGNAAFSLDPSLQSWQWWLLAAADPWVTALSPSWPLTLPFVVRMTDSLHRTPSLLNTDSASFFLAGPFPMGRGPSADTEDPPGIIDPGKAQ